MRRARGPRCSNRRRRPDRRNRPASARSRLCSRCRPMVPDVIRLQRPSARELVLDRQVEGFGIGSFDLAVQPPGDGETLSQWAAHTGNGRGGVRPVLKGRVVRLTKRGESSDRMSPPDSQSSCSLRMIHAGRRHSPALRHNGRNTCPQPARIVVLIRCEHRRWPDAARCCYSPSASIPVCRSGGRTARR